MQMSSRDKRIVTISKVFLQIKVPEEELLEGNRGSQ